MLDNVEQVVCDSQQWAEYERLYFVSVITQKSGNAFRKSLPPVKSHHFIGGQKNVLFMAVYAETTIFQEKSKSMPSGWNMNKSASTRPQMV